MTKFTSLVSESKEKKETVFIHYLDSNKEMDFASSKPSIFDNVLYIGRDENYGDVFKAWNDDEIGFALYFGTKGDEFDN